jgi:hypothetical protein
MPQSVARFLVRMGLGEEEEMYRPFRAAAWVGRRESQGDTLGWYLLALQAGRCGSAATLALWILSNGR